MDSFKRLWDDDGEILVPQHTLKNIEKRVHGSTQPVRFAANTVELFVSKAMSTVLAMFGEGSRLPKKNIAAVENEILDGADPAAGGIG